MTTPAIIMEHEFHTRKDEYYEWLKKWILAQDKKYDENIARRQAQLRDPNYVIRHPSAAMNDPEPPFEMKEWYWSEGLFCGDISYDAPEEFFQEDYSNWLKSDEPDSSVPLMEEMDRLFDKAFREVMPEALHHVLEG